MNIPKEQIKSLNIIRVAERLGLEIKNRTALCVAHEERHPSMHLYEDSRRWKCFSCGESGDVISLVQKKLGLEYIDACKWLCNEYGLDCYSFKRRITKIRIRKAPAIIKEKINSVDTEVYSWIINNTYISPAAEQFLYKERKLKKYVVEQQNVRSIEDPIEFKKMIVAQWGEQRLFNCGLLTSHKSKENLFYGFVWYLPCLLFPYYNENGDIINIQARTLGTNDKRFMNLSKIPTYIYNVPILGTLDKNSNLLICEGVTDCLAALSMGRDAVAIPGAAAFKDEYIQLLEDYNLIIIPDNDSSGTGRKFADDIATKFSRIYKNINILPLNGYKDIAELYIANC